MSSSLITPVIICGGSGTRLWPLSRESQPKQFIPIGGGTSTFQQVLARVADPDIFASPIVVTNTEFRFTVADQLQRSSVSGDILLEPVGRDSGPAIAVATEFAGRRNREAILLVLAADHIVHDTDAFRRSCQQALPATAQGHLVTFGVHPSGPATSYGYIRPGAKLDGSAAHEVAAFVEKPDQATAARYVAEGYLWNCDFLFRADRMLDELAHFERRCSPPQGFS
jgi:mannose-1-phosphate guanylyltransferase/mannose-6-phosphate isomerase